MGFKHIGNAVFVDEDSTDVSEIVHEDLGEWKFHPYVEFSSLERAYYGFVMLKSPPGTPDQEKIYGTIDHTMIWENSIAPLFDFGDALKELQEPQRSRSFFEEYPYLEVESKEKYKELLNAEHPVLGPKDWTPGKRRKKPDWSEWKGPGVYDMREVPPVQAYPSVEAYETEAMEREADETTDFMFQGDEWKDLVTQMIEDNKEEIFAS